MLRFGFAVMVGSFVACSLFACGEKLNPKGDEPTALGGAGGSTGVGAIDGGESEAGVGIDGAGGTTTAPVTYSKTIAPMVAASCTGASCHGGSNPALGIGLDTYAGLKSFADLCNTAIQSGAMPIGGGSALTAADKNNFQDWVNAGAPNN
jgi:hypothetical protein